MRKTATTALIFFSLIGSAKAGTITSVGAVSALTNISQMASIAGTAAFDEGPTSGSVPLGQYTAQGLTWQTGPLTAILPGVSTPGTATGPIYVTGASYFPAPIAGGGAQVGQFNYFAGLATFTNTTTQVGLTASKNGTQYLTAWSKSGAMIGQVTWMPNSDAAFVGIDTLGVAIGMVAYGNHDLWNGGTYSVGGSTIMSDTWVWGSGKCLNNASCVDGNPCTDDVCNAVGVCVHTSNAASCNDGNPCTTNDVCQAGACAGGSPVVCAAMDGCHDVGACSPMTGVCSDPAKPDGSACSDANACTQMDTCQAGVCASGGSVMCPPPDGCHAAGACDPLTGMCSNPAKPDGAPCDDNNACTKMDTCQAGACAGANPVACAAMDACHDVGMCDPLSGMCSNPAKADGTACDDKNACTKKDTCQAGACTGANPVACMALDSCHDVGTCDAVNGVCSNPAKPDGASCDGDGTCMSAACGMPDGGTPTSSSASSGSGTSSGSSASNGGGGGPAGTGGGSSSSGAGGDNPQFGGCGCGVSSESDGSAIGVGLLLLLAARRRSKRAAPSALTASASASAPASAPAPAPASAPAPAPASAPEGITD